MKCERCGVEVATGFYCTNCGLIPDWRAVETEELETERSRHQLDECIGSYCLRCIELDSAVDKLRGDG